MYNVSPGRPWPRVSHPVQLALILLLLSSFVTVAITLQPVLTVVGILALVGGAAVLAYPVFGLYLMFAFFLVQGSPLYESYGIFARSYTASDVVGALVLLGWVLRCVKPASSRPLGAMSGRNRLALVAVAAYFAWAALSSAWSSAPFDQLTTSVRDAAEAATLFALAVLLLDEPKKVRGAAGTYAVIGTILALYTIGTFLSKHGFDTSLAVSGSETYRGGLPETLNANALAATLAIVPGFAYLAAGRLSRRARLALTSATMPIIGLALIILTSRQILVAVALAVVAIVVLGRGIGNRLAIAPIVLLGAVTLLGLVATGHLPTYFQSRVAAARYDNLNDRLPIWHYGLDVFAAHPVAGVGAEGLETALAYTPLNTSAQSDFVRTLADYGLVGFALLLAMLVILGRIAIVDGGRNAASIGIAVVLLVSMAASSILKEHWTWVPLSIVCCYGLARNALEGTQAIGPRPAPAALRPDRSSATSRIPVVPPRA